MLERDFELNIEKLMWQRRITRNNTEKSREKMKRLYARGIKTKLSIIMNCFIKILILCQHNERCYTIDWMKD